jgi:hypothetical protein
VIPRLVRLLCIPRHLKSSNLGINDAVALGRTLAAVLEDGRTLSWRCDAIALNDQP